MHISVSVGSSAIEKGREIAEPSQCGDRIYRFGLRAPFTDLRGFGLSGFGAWVQTGMLEARNRENLIHASPIRLLASQRKNRTTSPPRLPVCAELGQLLS